VALLLGGGAIPVNDGLYRPIEVHVPLGSFLNPDQPLAVRARANACHRVYNAVMLAMSKAAPEQVLTSGHDTTNAIGMGTDRKFQLWPTVASEPGSRLRGPVWEGRISRGEVKGRGTTGIGVKEALGDRRKA
jgi:N-methylhydantoinase B/oxoprolinase/acetone carboxylase alpha subunit